MNRRSRRAERFERIGSKPVTGRHVLGSFMPFAAPTTQTSDGWTVLAYEVSMRESDVVLTRADFEDCVRNFASYPCAPVTIEHADTDFNPFAQPPTSWREPNGHVEELRVGTMTRGSTQVATLEGRVSYLEPTKTDVAAKKWRFGSITINQDAVDEETGKTLGSMLWSWSLTAHPRLTGLPAIAASKLAPGGELIEAGWWYGDIDGRDDLLSCLRTLLDLPVTSTEAEVLAELTKLEGYVADPASATAAGIETDDIVCRLRDALRLPALTSAADVLAEVRKGLDTLPTDDMPAATTTTPSGAATDPATMSRSNTPPEKSIMNKFTLILAGLGLPAVANEDAAETRVTASAQLGVDALKSVGLPITATPAEFAARIAALKSAETKLAASEQELATFRAQAAERSKLDRAAYLDDLVAARPELAPVRASLALHLESDPTGFASAYPRPSREDITKAAAEGAQRAQDGARTQSVTVNASNPVTRDAPKVAGADAKPSRAAFAAVLEECGYPNDAATITEAIAKGHTPETLRAALTAQA